MSVHTQKKTTLGKARGGNGQPCLLPSPPTYIFAEVLECTAYFRTSNRDKQHSTQLYRPQNPFETDPGTAFMTENQSRNRTASRIIFPRKSALGLPTKKALLSKLGDHLELSKKFHQGNLLPYVPPRSPGKNATVVFYTNIYTRRDTYSRWTEVNTATCQTHTSAASFSPIQSPPRQPRNRKNS